MSELKINQVYSFKLGSGEELIAKVVDVSDNSVGIEHPLSVAPSPQGMGLVPSLFTADTNVTVRLNTSSISLYAMSDASVTSKYIEATTGIKMPDKRIVLG